MKYNNKLKPLVLPEYGRNVQQMVDHCLTIEDKEEREICAKSIIKTMQSVAPEHKKNGEGASVYWDHLAVMSNFSLDIDFPEGTITEDKIKGKIGKSPYQSHHIIYKCYGHIVQELIKKVIDMSEGDDKRNAEYQTAIHMKRLYMTWNKDNVEDIKIFKDLYELSEGKIMLTPENCKLNINPNSIEKGTSKLRARRGTNNRRR